MLSIIVPTYNVKSYIEECVDSLLVQSYTNCEIIIVDDGSTDDSGKICDKLLLKDSRIKVIHQKNEGLSSARNTGLRHACGEYISFIDSDDFVSPSMYTDMIDALEKNDADVAVCNFEVFNKENRYKSSRYKDEVVKYTHDNQLKFFGATLDSSCNHVYRAEPIRKYGLMFEPKSKVAQEDYWFLVRLFAHVSCLVTISSCFYKYRERKSSITKSHSDGDITGRCLNFLSLSKDYILSNSDKECNDFLHYAYVNMFMASINNVFDTKPSTIRNIVKSYLNDKCFSEAISIENLREVLCGERLKNKYDKMCFSLLRHRYLMIYSLLESLRLKKLRSSNRTSIYFE